MEDRFKYKIWNKIDKNWCNGIVFTNDAILCSTDHMMCLCEDAYIVCKCSGRKDKNEKLIYENDIIKTCSIVNTNIEIIGRVEWSDVYTQYVIRNTGSIPDEGEGLYEYDDMEIIGNKYENSELITSN